MTTEFKDDRTINNAVKIYYSIFFFITFLKKTGSKERMAKKAKIRMECIETCPEAVVSWYNVVPARMKKKEGGATPTEGTQPLLIPPVLCNEIIKLILT